MKREIILSGLMLILVISAVSAEITISQPKAVYNINDILGISASIKPGMDSDTILTAKLYCGNSSKEIASESLFLSAGQEYGIEKKRPLTTSFLEGMSGNCRIDIGYNAEVSSTPVFVITRLINIKYNLDKTAVNPGEKFNIHLTATKANSENLEGMAELIADEGTKITAAVTGGTLDKEFSFPDSVRSGTHKISVLVYEKLGNEIINKGETEILVTIIQNPRVLEIATDKANVVPGSSLLVRTAVYDQASDLINTNSKIEIVNKQNNVIYSRLVSTGEESSFYFPENSSSGYWKINSYSSNLESSREFHIEELEKAKFEIVGNDTLIITNVGNVPYSETLFISIGAEVLNESISLEIGEVLKRKLNAPNGVYDVKISDGKSSFQASSVSLTGKAISVGDMQSSLGMFNRYPLVWLFVILVLGMFAFTMSQRVIKKRFYGYVPKEEKKKEEKKNVGIIKLSPSRKAEEAEHSLVMHGNKEDASVIVMRIKNHSSLNGAALDSVNLAVEKIKESRGSVYKNNNEIVGIFAPSVTKTFKNELAAVKVAAVISSSLNEHNKRFAEKIDFGIGIHSGSIASSVEQGKLKFTPLGNAINLAKKVADSASNAVLVSSEINKKINPEVKTLRQGEFYSISRIVEREQHKDFLTGFKERNKFS